MKKLIYTAFVICGMLTASCSDLLNLESKTDVTNNYLFTTPEGLNTAVTGLYSLARELPGGADNNESNLYIVTMCDFNTDIAILRAGVSTSIGRLNTSFTPSTGDVNKFWKHHYGIIGKANEIIVAWDWMTAMCSMHGVKRNSSEDGAILNSGNALTVFI